MSQRRTVLFGARFRVDRFDLPARDGSFRTRELVVHPGAVVILPILDDGRVVLIRNHRPMLGKTLLELPAGTLEPGEEPALAAARELHEETGYQAESLIRVSRFFASPGITDELMHLFAARGLRPGTQALDPTEQIEVVPMSFDDALTLCRDGSIEDAKTLVALLHHACFGSADPV